MILYTQSTGNPRTDYSCVMIRKPTILGDFGAYGARLTYWDGRAIILHVSFGETQWEVYV